MKNNSIDPLFISALDILTGALGVFIIMNFISTRMIQQPNIAQKEEPKKEIAKVMPITKPEVKPPNTYTSNQRYSKPPVPERPEPNPVHPVPPPPANAGAGTNNNPSSAPQDPVSVDLMKQTKGAVVLLLQQSDQAKVSVEFMLRQGSKTWKPGRASKYQDEVFQFEKRMGYYFQTEIRPGSYEVLVRKKKGAKSTDNQPFAFYGKIIPTGQKSKTYAFGQYAANSLSDDWVRAGTLQISPGDLSYSSPMAKVKP